MSLQRYTELVEENSLAVQMRDDQKRLDECIVRLTVTMWEKRNGKISG